MQCSDVPALLKFEQHALEHQDCPITQSSYARVKELIAPVPAPAEFVPTGNNTDTMILRGLKQGCSAVEEATRIIWACAACTDQITPTLWSDAHDFNEALVYFRTLSDLDLMNVTKEYRLTWEIQQQ